MKISIKDVEHAAKLARLGLSVEEKEKFARQLDQIIEYAETINKLETANIEPTLQAIPMQNIFRLDSEQPFAEVKQLLDIAPQTEENMYKVPRILE